MATKLDNLFIERRKLFANLPRFQRKVLKGDQWRSKEAREEQGGRARVDSKYSGQ